MNKPVYIHAGSHRSGTSSFQMCLYENRFSLRKAGFDLAYPGRDGVPEGALRLRLPAPRDGLKRARDFVPRLRTHLSRISPDPRRALILSEENIPGIMPHFFRGRFHPVTRVRLEVLDEVLGARPRFILFVPRSYDELFVSAYRKLAEDRAMKPFADCIPGLLAMRRGWPHVVAELRDLLKPEALVVVPYERRGESRELLARLVPGLDPGRLKEPDRTLNLSATDAALQRLQAVYRDGGEPDAAERAAIIAAHADDRAPRGIVELAPEQRNALRDRYRRDMARLGRMREITVV